MDLFLNFSHKKSPCLLKTLSAPFTPCSIKMFCHPGRTHLFPIKIEKFDNKINFPKNAETVGESEDNDKR